ncbi:hypothetical protein J6590_090755, partial [Homalodisca vitripennis]
METSTSETSMIEEVQPNLRRHIRKHQLITGAFVRGIRERIIIWDQRREGISEMVIWQDLRRITGEFFRVWRESEECEKGILVEDVVMRVEVSWRQTYMCINAIAKKEEQERKNPQKRAYNPFRRRHEKLGLSYLYKKDGKLEESLRGQFLDHSVIKMSSGQLIGHISRRRVRLQPITVKLRPSTHLRMCITGPEDPGSRPNYGYMFSGYVTCQGRQLVAPVSSENREHVGPGAWHPVNWQCVPHYREHLPFHRAFWCSTTCSTYYPLFLDVTSAGAPNPGASRKFLLSMELRNEVVKVDKERESERYIDLCLSNRVVVLEATFAEII